MQAFCRWALENHKNWPIFSQFLGVTFSARSSGAPQKSGLVGKGLFVPSTRYARAPFIVISSTITDNLHHTEEVERKRAVMYETNLMVHTIIRYKSAVEIDIFSPCLMHIVRSSFSSNYEQNYIRGPITQIKSSVHWCQEWRVRLPRVSSRKTCFSCLRISRKWNIGRIGDSGEREKMHIKDYEITCSHILSSPPCCTYVQYQVRRKMEHEHSLRVTFAE